MRSTGICFAALAIPLLMAGCVPLKKAHLNPETSIRQATVRALRASPETWTIELRLPDPSGAVSWQVAPEGSAPVSRKTEDDQSVFTWEILAARWRDKRPFLVQVQAAGLDETIRIPHPTYEQGLAEPLWIVLRILQPIPHF